VSWGIILLRKYFEIVGFVIYFFVYIISLHFQQNRRVESFYALSLSGYDFWLRQQMNFVTVLYTALLLYYAPIIIYF